jgi:hypothetical protein
MDITHWIFGYVAQCASGLENGECQVGWCLHTGYLLCVINTSCTFWVTFSKLCTIITNTLKICMGRFGSVRTFFLKNLHVVAFFHHVLNRRYLLSVVTSSHTPRTTFSKLYIVIIDTLKMNMLDEISTCTNFV